MFYLPTYAHINTQERPGLVIFRLAPQAKTNNGTNLPTSLSIFLALYETQWFVARISSSRIFETLPRKMVRDREVKILQNGTFNCYILNPNHWFNSYSNEKLKDDKNVDLKSISFSTGLLPMWL